MMPVANLATGTAQWWQNGRFWAWEGVCCCEGTCTHVWNYAQADAWLFPELARSTRIMQDLGEAFEETSGLVGFRSDRNFAATARPAPCSSAIASTDVAGTMRSSASTGRASRPRSNT